MEISEEVGLGREHTAAEPDGEALERMSDDVALDLLGGHTGIHLRRIIGAFCYFLANVSFEAFGEVLEHRRTAAQSDIVI